MYYKKIFPAQVLNLYATEYICELPLTNNVRSRKFEIEFYDKDGHPLLSRKGEISGLPIDNNLVEYVDQHNAFDYSSPEAQKMFDEQDEYIFNEIKRMFGLTYYDDTYETNINREFSYLKYVSPGAELNIWKPIPL